MNCDDWSNKVWFMTKTKQDSDATDRTSGLHLNQNWIFMINQTGCDLTWKAVER